MKNIIQNLDLYGLDILLTYIKEKFIYISFCKNSIPTAGSFTIQTNDLTKFAEGTKIEKIIYHKSGQITIKTNRTFLKLTN